MENFIRELNQDASRKLIMLNTIILLDETRNEETNKRIKNFKSIKRILKN
jgi:hypothetical protein